MTRLLLLSLSALLAPITTVYAKDEFIRVYSFADDQCYGPPQLGNIDLKVNECHNFPAAAHGVKPFKHDDDIKWVHDINNGGSQCKLIAYNAVGCLDSQQSASVDLPIGIQQCLGSAPGDSVYSIKFSCGTTVTSSAVKSTYTTTWTATSWSFDTHGKPTAHHSTNTFTLSGRANNNAAAEPSPDPSPTHLQPRALNDDNHRSVWMFHPWSRSVVCYACYTTKPYDFTTLECRSGPAHAGECGDRPTETDDVFSTSTMTLTSTLTAATAPMSTTTSTSTSFTTLSTTLSFPSSPTAATDLERRKSWHRRVTFTHPFFPAQKLCADAEWEKRGQPETEIRLQKIGTDMDKCGKEDEVWDLSVPADVSRFVDTTVVVGQVVTDVATVTRTVLVMPVVDGRGEEGVIVHGDL